MKPKRYIYSDEPLAADKAASQRAGELEDIMSDIEYLKGEIAELDKKFWNLKGSPLPTSHRVQITLNPGDPGYDEAPESFSPQDYLGDTDWVNNVAPLP